MNIAIIGGSITEGAGASNYKNTYVYRLEQYLKEEYENIVVKNLGSGGTASQFGIFRLKRDLGDFRPDVIFIEFAVNDRIYDSNEASIYFEGLIRECMKITKRIISIDFPTGMGDSCVSIHKKMSYYYNVPLIDVQDEVWRRIGKRELKWADISIDNIHPNDKGHELYYEIIKENLTKVDLRGLKATFISETLMGYRFNNPRISSYEELEFYGRWREESFRLNNKFDNAAVTENVGDGVIFRFKGKYLAMMNLLSKDSGILECELDNFIFNIDLYKDTEGVYSNTINLRNLENKEHTLVMKLSSEKNNNSMGNKIVIGGFLVER
ncbi:SGNH/GDSL hydrolase family protein [Clostridium beijerinckii]|uniref:SGNH/GDSL hydrolase family protein n=1 Tax=Clostridium beijerinckii TaxID=1520 RepID=UPI001570F9D5|nr:SGNH/GDSL hydrolase family protein [Clostridium beijerinckii]NRT73683.1 lysophospholipase L1-like esterase [Clostridium beijerinckii]